MTTIADSLAETLARQIASGAYKAGDKLPSLRELAQLHRYAKNTVVAAFELLVSRGLVEPRRGSGYFVLPQQVVKPVEEDAGSLGRAMDIVWLMREQLKTQPDAIAVGDGFPPVEWLADVRLDKYHPKVVRTGLGALFRYGSRFGYAPLRDHLVRKLADFGIGAEPRQIVLTHGANEAMDIVIRYCVPPGGKVLVDDPGYYPSSASSSSRARRCWACRVWPTGPTSRRWSACSLPSARACSSRSRSRTTPRAPTSRPPRPSACCSSRRSTTC